MSHSLGVLNTVSPTTIDTYDLSYLLDDPIDAVENYQELIEICLDNNNPHAHYIQGLSEYFHKKHSTQVLEHLKRSADGKCDYAIYSYGLLMISRGNMAEGKRYMSTLGWKIDMKRVDQCWKKVKKSLIRFQIERKKSYVHNMFLLKPARRCHLNTFDKRCKRCFLYKQVMKFIDYI